MEIRLLTGARMRDHVDALARLRIAVFREFPYLYDGDIDYETRYLDTYARSEQSLCVLAIDAGRPVGAATGIPLDAETEECRRPFEAAGIDPAEVFYFGESVLLPAYRGRGLGVRFIDEREAYARRLERFRLCAFCAVERPLDHPRRPPGYQPLDAFWRRRGFAPAAGLATSFRWRDIDEATESAKPMNFWIKEIAG
ncbi:GNAT family N-acetyltransferase [Halotalea alkalilenta]|uniref:GNAT family N-acetyltransferase n=1 Tax=Halotalea alkalilenta TaxID=376489 RepID=UPI000487C15E|nr:GNAT family N-acetyltransferase [Halotalea alkalilenta]